MANLVDRRGVTAGVNELDQVTALADRAIGLYQTFYRGVHIVVGDAEEKMKISHEETKSAKMFLAFLRALRFFVTDFPQESFMSQ